jgi:hypothetical protein
MFVERASPCGAFFRLPFVTMQLLDAILKGEGGEE